MQLFFDYFINKIMKKLFVIFGGSSCEHDISIITGMQLCKNLETKYSVEKIYLGLDNNFYLATKVQDISYFADKNIKLKQIIISDGAIYIKNLVLKKYCDVDCVINCCHGGVGENGDLAGFFAVNKIRTTSACSLSSHIAMDKYLTKRLVSDIVPVVKGELVTIDNYLEKKKSIKKDYKNIIVKPNSLGSSIGVKVCDKKNFTEQIMAIFTMNDDALVEECITNKIEYNQACYKKDNELMLSEIESPITKSEYLSFEDKYIHEGKSKRKDRVIPAKMSADLKSEINFYTAKIYNALKLDGVVRIDYIYDLDAKILYFNEVNTVPGSMAYYLFEPLGIDYITLVEDLVDNAPSVKKYSYFDSGILRKKLL